MKHLMVPNLLYTWSHLYPLYPRSQNISKYSLYLSYSLVTKWTKYSYQTRVKADGYKILSTPTLTRQVILDPASWTRPDRGSCCCQAPTPPPSHLVTTHRSPPMVSVLEGCFSPDNKKVFAKFCLVLRGTRLSQKFLKGVSAGPNVNFSESNSGQNIDFWEKSLGTAICMHKIFQMTPLKSFDEA